MLTDAINDEILQIKHSLAAALGNDLDRIVADARSRQQDVVRLPPRKPEFEPSSVWDQKIFPAERTT